MSSVDFSALIAYAGKYERSLFATLLNALDAITDCTLYQSVKNKINLTKLKVRGGARPYSINLDARQGDLQYTNRVLEAHLGKRDLLIVPSEYRDTWMSEMMNEGVDNKDIPFAQFMWEQVMADLAAEINDHTIYFGFDKTTAVVFNAGATYAVGNYITFKTDGTITDYYKCISATTAGQTPLTHPAKWQLSNAEAIAIGFAELILAAITGGRLAPVNTGTIDSSNAYGQFTDVWRSMPKPYRKAGAVIYASIDSTDCLMDDFENKVSKYIEIDPLTNDMYLAKTQHKCKIVPATWMGESGRLICTPKANMLIGTDRISDLNKINTKENLRSIEAGIDFGIGVNWRDDDAIRVNNVA